MESLIIFMATVLHALNISSGADTSGNPVPLSAEVTGDFLM